MKNIKDTSKNTLFWLVVFGFLYLMLMFSLDVFITGTNQRAVAEKFFENTSWLLFIGNPIFICFGYILCYKKEQNSYKRKILNIILMGTVVVFLWWGYIGFTQKTMGGPQPNPDTMIILPDPSSLKITPYSAQ